MEIVDLLSESVLRETYVPGPKDAEFYEKRYCYKFVKGRNGVCEGCKMAQNNGRHTDEDVRWNSENCTKTDKTDSYGKLSFIGSRNKVASYIRIDYDTVPKDFLQFMYSPDSWDLVMPNLILTVTSGTRNFTLPLRIKEAFKRGIVKAAICTKAWIFSNGLNNGVAKLVGEAISEQNQRHSFTLIGIAPWGMIAGREKLKKFGRSTDDGVSKLFEEYDDNDEYALNDADLPCVLSKFEDKGLTNCMSLEPNHTHYILVDDGSREEPGRNTEFSHRLQYELRRGKPLQYYENLYSNQIALTESICSDIKQSEFNPILFRMLERRIIKMVDAKIPSVLIVVNGGPEVLREIAEAVENSVPVLIMAGSRGCADNIVKAINLTSPRSQDDLARIIDEIVDNDKSVDKIEALKDLNSILSKEEDFINVFRLDFDEGSQDIEYAILRTVLNSRKDKSFENLKYAIKWNRYDIAKSEILTGEEKFDPQELNNLMEMALVDNTPNFVALLLDIGLELDDFLRIGRLYYLYNCDEIRKDMQKQPIYQLFKLQINQNSVITFHKLNNEVFGEFGSESLVSFLPEDLDVEEVGKFIELANQTNYSTINIANPILKSKIEAAKENLFLWGILLNRFDISYLMWKLSDHQIFLALLGAKILRSLGAKLPREASLLSNAAGFENSAIGVLDLFDKRTDTDIHRVLLRHTVKQYQMNCLEIAVDGNSKNFLSHQTVRTVLTNVWFGKLVQKTGFIENIKFAIGICSFGVLAPFVGIFDKSQQLSEKETRQTLNRKLAELNKKTTSSKIEQSLNTRSQETLALEFVSFKKWVKNTERSAFIKRYKLRLYEFLYSPRVRFIYDVMSRIAFLMLFSYMLLCDFDYINLNEPRRLIKRSQRKPNLASSDEIGEDIDEFNRTTKEIITTKLLSTTTQPQLSSLTYSWTQERHKVSSIWFPEFLLTVWVISLLAQEIRQFFARSNGIGEVLSKVVIYFNDEWNYIDLMGCGLFFFGLVLRLISMVTNENVFSAARIILCIDLCIWYLKLLHVSLAFEAIGPKLVMIQKMIVDLMFFMFIIVVFMFAFGVTTHAALFPNNKFSFSLFNNILDNGYWAIFGEMKLLDYIKYGKCDDGKLNCRMPLRSGVAFSYIVFMIYMVIVNILLINLLIAMFSFTFESVQTNAKQIWNFQRNGLVNEYLESPILPAPLSLFVITFDAIRNLIKGKPIDSVPIEDKLSPINIENLYDTEKKFCEEYMRTLEWKKEDENDTILRRNMDMLDRLEQKVNTITETQNRDSTKVGEAVNWLMKKQPITNPMERIPFIKIKK